MRFYTFSINAIERVLFRCVLIKYVCGTIHEAVYTNTLDNMLSCVVRKKQNTGKKAGVLPVETSRFLQVQAGLSSAL